MHTTGLPGSYRQPSREPSQPHDGLKAVEFGNVEYVTMFIRPPVPAAPDSRRMGRTLFEASLPSQTLGSCASSLMQRCPLGLVSGYLWPAASMSNPWGFILGRWTSAMPPRALTSHTPFPTRQPTPADTSCPSRQTHSSRHSQYQLVRHILADFPVSCLPLWRCRLCGPPDLCVPLAPCAAAR